MENRKERTQERKATHSQKTTVAAQWSTSQLSKKMDLLIEWDVNSAVVYTQSEETIGSMTSFLV